MPEKDTLLVTAKKTYHALLQEDVSSTKVLEARAVETTDSVSLPEGWALKLAKELTRFNGALKKHLEEQFNFQHQQDTSKTLRKCRYSPEQIQSFFSRMAYKLRHAVDIDNLDIRAAQEEHARVL